MVLHQGKNMGIIHTKDANKEEIGLMMMGSLDLTEGIKNYGYAKDSSLSDEEWKKIHGNRK